MHEYLLELIKTCVSVLSLDSAAVNPEQRKYADRLCITALRLLDDDLSKAALQKQGVEIVKG